MSKENLEQFIQKVPDNEQLQARIGDEMEADSLSPSVDPKGPSPSIFPKHPRRIGNGEEFSKNHRYGSSVAR
jgi:hypothetical protein